MSTTIIKISFAKGSDQIRVGVTPLNNCTITGTCIHSDTLDVSYYNTLVELPVAEVEGMVATLVFPLSKEGKSLINKINKIQEARPVNARGNKVPFVYLTVEDAELIIFNKGDKENPDRLTFVDVNATQVKVEDKVPFIVINSLAVNKTSVVRTSSLQSKTQNYYSLV